MCVCVCACGCVCKKTSVAVMEWPAYIRQFSTLTCTYHVNVDFSAEPGVANEMMENEPKSCLTVA